jgi:vacuolar iron transporter family protein
MRRSGPRNCTQTGETFARIGRAKTQMMRALVHVFGPDFVLKTVAASEYADRDKYAGQPDAVGMSEEEHRHAGIVQDVANRGTAGQSRGNQIAAAEPWHRGVSSGND